MVDNMRYSLRRMRISTGVSRQKNILPHFMLLILPAWIWQSLLFFIHKVDVHNPEIQIQIRKLWAWRPSHDPLVRDFFLSNSNSKTVLGVYEVHVCIKLTVVDDSQIARDRFANRCSRTMLAREIPESRLLTWHWRAVREVFPNSANCSLRL